MIIIIIISTSSINVYIYVAAKLIPQQPPPPSTCSINLNQWNIMMWYNNQLIDFHIMEFYTEWLLYKIIQLIIITL